MRDFRVVLPVTVHMQLARLPWYSERVGVGPHRQVESGRIRLRARRRCSRQSARGLRSRPWGPRSTGNEAIPEICNPLPCTDCNEGLDPHVDHPDRKHSKRLQLGYRFDPVRHGIGVVVRDFNLSRERGQESIRLDRLAFQVPPPPVCAQDTHLSTRIACASPHFVRSGRRELLQ